MGRGPYAKSAARRAEILCAARDSFAERGYAASSLRDIAERAGTTHAVLQHHFAGKDELLMAVLAQRDADERAAGEREAEQTFGGLAAYLARLLRSHQEAPELMRLWAELAVAASRPDHPAHEYVVRRYELVRTRIAAAVTDAGELDSDSATTLVHALLNGLQIVWLLDPRLDIVTPLERFMALIGADGSEPVTS
ncbi:helix-turn-helix domain-containing protein [Amycolatopsis sp. NPDC021455]|uniref:TetR/AcrR family transcriptional regulator n=1 Tax=Amycolatopsis sp. NPDC021455 TaxID=3154901 RepID=UPI0033D66302